MDQGFWIPGCLIGMEHNGTREPIKMMEPIKIMLSMDFHGLFFPASMSGSDTCFSRDFCWDSKGPCCC